MVSTTTVAKRFPTTRFAVSSTHMSTELSTWPDMQRPRASAEWIKLFIDMFGTQKFRHADELVPILRRSDLNESYITCSELRLDDQLRRIYRVRAQHLASTPRSPCYPSGLADDVRALADQLDEAGDQTIRVWDTLLPSGTAYLVFELMDDRTVAGCVKSIDRRIVDPPPW